MRLRKKKPKNLKTQPYIPLKKTKTDTLKALDGSVHAGCRSMLTLMESGNGTSGSSVKQAQIHRKIIRRYQSKNMNIPPYAVPVDYVSVPILSLARMAKPCMTQHGHSMNTPPMGSLVTFMKILLATGATAPGRYAQSMKSMITAHITKIPLNLRNLPRTTSQAWSIAKLGSCFISKLSFGRVAFLLKREYRRGYGFVLILFNHSLMGHKNFRWKGQGYEQRHGKKGSARS